MQRSLTTYVQNLEHPRRSGGVLVPLDGVDACPKYGSLTNSEPLARSLPATARSCRRRVWLVQQLTTDRRKRQHCTESARSGMERPETVHITLPQTWPDANYKKSYGLLHTCQLSPTFSGHRQRRRPKNLIAACRAIVLLKKIARSHIILSLSLCYTSKDRCKPWLCTVQEMRAQVP
jgi:hypothetical protein